MKTSKSSKTTAADTKALLLAMLGRAEYPVFSETASQSVSSAPNFDLIESYLPRLASKYNLEISVLQAQLRLLFLGSQDRASNPKESEEVSGQLIEEILEKEEIQSYATPIWEMSETELRQRFSTQSSDRPIAAKIIKNIIWQVYTWIRQGKHDLIRGNLRSFWYMRVKLPLGKVGLLDEKTDHYRTMSKVFSDLSRDFGLFSYRDFGFIDDDWENRRIGAQNPHVIIFSEKTGFFFYLKELHETFDVTVTALGGQPSVLSVEYMVEHILQNTSKDRPFYVYSIVDYDPSGRLIEQNFVELLQEQGLKDVKLKRMIDSGFYTPDEIGLYRYPLPENSRTRTINEKWLEATGGLAGELYGLEADSMPKERLMGMIASEMETLERLGELSP